MSGPFTFPGVVGIAREERDALVITVGFGPDDQAALMALAEAIARNGLPEGVVSAVVRTDARGPRQRQWEVRQILSLYALREKARADALQQRVTALEAELERARVPAA